MHIKVHCKVRTVRMESGSSSSGDSDGGSDGGGGEGVVAKSAAVAAVAVSATSAGTAQVEAETVWGSSCHHNSSSSCTAETHSPDTTSYGWT